jgi:anti-sigma regulatory factor (Ser/Thr protein kinase)
VVNATKEFHMVIPLMKQAADELGRDGHARLHYAAAWGPSTPRAVEARRDVRAVLTHAPHGGDRPAVPASRVMDAELVVSELITNVLRHAPGPCALTLRLTGTELSISLHDTLPDAPVVRPPDCRRVGGHGLHLVHAVSDRVVVTPRGRGKEITAHLRLTTSDDSGPAGRTILSVPPSGGTLQSS